MENEKIVVGLDIGTTKICAIVGRKKTSLANWKCSAWVKPESEGVIKGIVTNIDKTVFGLLRKQLKKQAICRASTSE